MRMIHVKPFSIQHHQSEHTTASDLQLIQSWLKQWTVPNNYKQTLLDVEGPDIGEDDPFRRIVKEFIGWYESVVGKFADHVLDDFSFTIILDTIEFGRPFTRTSGLQDDYTLRRLQEGLKLYTSYPEIQVAA